MKAIETKWKGWRFRSRTEARWAVFLEALGIHFDYEPEGVLLPSGPYLPDFRLSLIPQPTNEEPAPVWLEIKGGLPTDEEIARCDDLCAASGNIVLLAIGAPDASEQVLIFDPIVHPQIRVAAASLFGPFGFANVGGPDAEWLCLARAPGRKALKFEADGDDADPELLRQLTALSAVDAILLGISAAPPPITKTLYLGERLRRAYDAARAARFEFGETDKRWDR